MATKITVLGNGQPISGATVIAGCLAGSELTTNLRGVVEIPGLATGFVGYLQVVVRKAGVMDAVSLVELHEGETHTLDFQIAS